MPFSALTSPRALILAGLFVALAPLAAAQVVGAPRTQTLQLQAGPNLVSLDVVPAQTDPASIFGDALNHILLVKDGDGHLFAPSYGAPTLTAWAWDQAYLVHARQAVDIAVTGASLSGESSVPLEAGWNTVPYFLQAPTPVETALASILGHVTRVEDSEGRVYPAMTGTPELTTLVPGQGYRVRLDAPASLVYTAPPPPLPGADRTVNTMADALALTDLVAGQTIDVRGYHVVGDGGGGRFVVSDGNERPDGGVVFVPEMALSGPLTHTQTDASNPAYEFGPELPAGVYAPHRDWTMVYAPASGAGPFTINAWRHLAAHSYASGRHLTPGYDGDGVGVIPFGLRDRYGAGPWTLTYRATTGPLRLVRQGVGSELNVRWFGARAEAEAPNPADVTIGSDYDVQVAITWAVNLAQRRNDPAYGGTPGTVTTVRVPGSATYRFAGPVELTDGLTLAGDGGVAVVDATTTVPGAPEMSARLAAAGYAPGADYPWASYRTAPGGAPIPEVPGSISRWSHQNGVLTLHYRPARIVGAPTRLRLFDGVVALGLRMAVFQDDPGHPDALPPDVTYFVGKYQTSVTASSSPRANGNTPNQNTGDGPDVMAIGVRDLVLDGNWEGNQQLWTEGRFGWPGNAAPPEFENWMRNTPSWGGICVSNHGQKFIPVGQTIWLRGVAVLGFGSNGLLGNANNQWDGEAVLVGNSLWNHTIYSAMGRFRDLTATGFAWGHLQMTSNEVENLVFERGAWGPYRGGGLMLVRGDDAYTQAEVTQSTYTRRSDGTFAPSGLRANGVFVDGRDGGAFDVAPSSGPNTRIEGTVFLQHPDVGALPLAQESGNGWQRGLWAGHRYARYLSVRTGNGGQNQGFTPTGPFANMRAAEMLDVDARSGAQAGYAAYGTPIVAPVGWFEFTRPAAAGPDAGTNPWSERLVQVFEHIDSDVLTEAAFGVSNHFNRVPGSGSGAFQPDSEVAYFDVRSGGTRAFLLDVHVRNTENSLVRGPNNNGGWLSGAERYAEFYVRGSSFRLYDAELSRSTLLRQLAYFDDVTFVGGDTDLEPGRQYRSEDAGTATAAGGETTLDVPTTLFWTPVEPWTNGGQSFSGGRLAFSGPAAAKVQSHEWVLRAGPDAWRGDWRAPVLRVTFSQPLAPGETLSWDAAVRPWPAGVVVPAP